VSGAKEKEMSRNGYRCVADAPTATKEKRRVDMKQLMMVLAVAGLMVVGTVVADAAQTLMFDRGLPNTNINNAAGANRSNVTWASSENTGFTGDDFVIGTVGKTYVVDSITVWGAQYEPLSSDISNIWLYVGEAGSSLSMISTGSVTGNTNSNPDITHTYVSYPDGDSTDYYEGNGGVHYPVCETTFGNLGFVVQGGVKYNFGVRGDDYLWWNHASNAALSGSPQDGADDLYLEFADLSAVWVMDSNRNNEGGSGWDKSSDINIQIYASELPPVSEPTGLGLLGLALLGLRKRRS
jgi:hypothetical protein